MNNCNNYNNGCNINPKKLIEEYIKEIDWEVKENSNQLYSFSSMLLKLGGEVIRNYVLYNVYTPEIRKAYFEGYFHIHDLWFGLIPYCCGWDMRDILLKGFGGVKGRISSKPPKHLDSLVGQIVNFLGTMQMEFAGAQALSHVDIFMAPFVWKDKLSYREVKQQIQQLIYHINVPSRWGCQTPFINFTFDIIPPKHLAESHAIVGGEYLDRTYEEFEEEIEMINKAFVEILMEGDKNRRIFTFPIITYNLTKDFPFDSEIADMIFELQGKYGTAYFQNYIGSGLDPNVVYAMCCRLQLDKSQLALKGFGFLSNERTGSIGVVTLNLALIAYEARKDENKFFEILDYYLELAKEALEIKRKVIEENFKRGLQPYARVYIDSYDRYFSTIGIIGMHEALLNLGFPDGIVSPEGHRFAIKVLMYIRERIKEFQQETGNLYNLEATPAESACYSLALKAKKKYPDIILSGTDDVPYLTNSTWLPVGYTDDLYFIIKHQEPLQRLYTGGTVLHIWLGEQLTGEDVKVLVEKVVRTKIPYFSITPTFSICSKHNYIPGKHEKCPYCGAETEIWSRIVGYHSPTIRWNKGKQQEFKERKHIFFNKIFEPPKYDITQYTSVEHVLNEIYKTNGGKKENDKD